MTKRKLEVTQCEITTTLANLSTAAHALREEPYKRIPYLAGIMTVAGYQVECLRQKTIELRTINAELLEQLEWIKAVNEALDESNIKHVTRNAELLTALESLLSSGCILQSVAGLTDKYISVPHPETIAAAKAAIASAKESEGE